ncbi:hypothetical protein AB0M02_29945 [Actinoplanes sp. NPDC051861]|uniref:hypothetical protein n=1 Tax=Actinoplanes sp. NPDC051861 TaxID=3155170 RepID=UPI00342334D8
MGFAIFSIPIVLLIVAVQRDFPNWVDSLIVIFCIAVLGVLAGALRQDWKQSSESLRNELDNLQQRQPGASGTIYRTQTTTEIPYTTLGSLAAKLDQMDKKGRRDQIIFVLIGALLGLLTNLIT